MNYASRCATARRLSPMTSRGTPATSIPAPTIRNVTLLIDKPMTPKVTAHARSGTAAVVNAFIGDSPRDHMLPRNIASSRLMATSNNGEA